MGSDDDASFLSRKLYLWIILLRDGKLIQVRYPGMERCPPRSAS